MSSHAICPFLNGVNWPEKRTISVERNVVFNQDDANSHDDTAIIYGEVLSEGEKEKVIQHPQNNAQNVVQPENKEPDNQKLQDDDPESHQGSKFPNKIPLPQSEDEAEPDSEPQEPNQPPAQNYSHSQHARHERGHYKAMNEGLVAAVTAIVEESPEDDEDEH